MLRSVLFFLCLWIVTSGSLVAQFEVDTTYSPEYLVNEILLGQGVLIGNVEFGGTGYAIGTFTDPSRNIGIDRGIILTTGSAFYIKGPNRSPYMGWASNTEGDHDLNNISYGVTHDAVVLEFDFITERENLVFNYVFASEEYLEYVGSQFNDVFAFLISGPDISNVNIARIPDTNIPITINNVNHETNSEYFVNNEYESPEMEYVYDPRKKKVVRNKNFKEDRNIPQYDVQFDGFTKVLQAKCRVIPNEIYHIKMAIADVSDGILDSGVFLEAGSFMSYGDEYVKIDKTFEKPHQEIASLDLPEVVVSEDSLPGKIRPVQPSVVESVKVIRFAFDSFALNDIARNQLDSFARKMNDGTGKIEIIGHTCDIGTDEYNMELSRKRAESVQKHLKSLGVGDDHMLITYYGEDRPMEPNTSPEGRKNNRRVELIYIKG